PRRGPRGGAEGRDPGTATGGRWLAHQRVRLEEGAAQVEDLVERRGLAELPELVALAGREVGELRRGRGLEHEHPPQQLDDVTSERQQIVPLAHRTVDRLERGGRVPAEERRG